MKLFPNQTPQVNQVWTQLTVTIEVTGNGVESFNWKFSDTANGNDLNNSFKIADNKLLSYLEELPENTISYAKFKLENEYGIMLDFTYHNVSGEGNFNLLTKYSHFLQFQNQVFKKVIENSRTEVTQLQSHLPSRLDQR